MSAQLTSEEIGLLRDSASKACTLLKALANEDRQL
ncbi:transcriptional regulator, partial [Pseudomonas sp. FSL R10-0071]|nr:transcriptional regulator [Pseudomonas sp. FSL R10-0071]